MPYSATPATPPKRPSPPPPSGLRRPLQRRLGRRRGLHPPRRRPTAGAARIGRNANAPGAGSAGRAANAPGAGRTGHAGRTAHAVRRSHRRNPGAAIGHSPLATTIQTIRRMRKRVASLKNAIAAIIAGRPKTVRRAQRSLRFDIDYGPTTPPDGEIQSSDRARARRLRMAAASRARLARRVARI